MDVWYNVAKSIVRTYLALFIEAIHVEGRDNLPPGPKIIVANHPHVTDGFILPFIIQEKIHFLIQADVFKVPFVGKLLALADQIPVRIGCGQEALAAARQKLGKGNVVAIFPEGRLSGCSREMRRAGAGAALLALETGVPLVPVGFYVPPEFVREFHTRLFRKENTGWWQLGGQCIVRIGEPWQPLLTATTDRSYRYLREFTDRFMASIQELVHQASVSFRQLSNPAE
jgi:1-acyl-sn-glycerol-3-phosphate acyltransferase